MLRLDPSYPPLWRTDSVLQLGADASLVVDHPAPWQERLLHELGRGVPEVALEPIARMLGAPPAQARPFVAGISRALEAAPVIGPARVMLQLPAGLATADIDAMTAALSSFGTVVTTGDAESVVHTPPRRGVPVVLVAHHVIDPRHAAALMREDVAHLPVVLSGRRVVIGPLIHPGKTACLACLDAHRRELDASWPLVAAQLVGRSGSSPGRALATEAAVAAGRLLNESEWRVAHSVTIYAESPRRTWRAHRPHPQCRCRSLGETATAAAAACLVTETTTATASARPA